MFIKEYDKRTNNKQVGRSRTLNTEQVMVTAPVDGTCAVYNENIKRGENSTKISYKLRGN